jgi:hypothetical protein
MATRWRARHRRKRAKVNRHVAAMHRAFAHYCDEYMSYDYGRDEDYDGDCGFCGGDGWVDGYEEDPLWFAPGELERCASCGGSGLAKDMTIW